VSDLQRVNRPDDRECVQTPAFRVHEVRREASPTVRSVRSGLVHVGQRLQRAMRDCVRGDGDQAVIALSRAVFGLLGLNGADQPTPHDASGERGRVHQHKYVQRIAIGAER
jgi:hypothetical protein